MSRATRDHFPSTEQRLEQLNGASMSGWVPSAFSKNSGVRQSTSIDCGHLLAILIRFKFLVTWCCSSANLLLYIALHCFAFSGHVVSATLRALELSRESSKAGSQLGSERKQIRATEKSNRLHLRVQPPFLGPSDANCICLVGDRLGG